MAYSSRIPTPLRAAVAALIVTTARGDKRDVRGMSHEATVTFTRIGGGRLEFADLQAVPALAVLLWSLCAHVLASTSPRPSLSLKRLTIDMSPVPGHGFAYHFTDTIATTAREVDFNAAMPNKSPMLPWRFGWRPSSQFNSPFAGPKMSQLLFGCASKLVSLNLFPIKPISLVPCTRDLYLVVRQFNGDRKVEEQKLPKASGVSFARRRRRRLHNHSAGMRDGLSWGDFFSFCFWTENTRNQLQFFSPLIDLISRYIALQSHYSTPAWRDTQASSHSMLFAGRKTREWEQQS